jgi:hypothetical protein
MVLSLKRWLIGSIFVLMDGMPRFWLIYVTELLGWCGFEVLAGVCAGVRRTG